MIPSEVRGSTSPLPDSDGGRSSAIYDVGLQHLAHTDNQAMRQDLQEREGY